MTKNLVGLYLSVTVEGRQKYLAVHTAGNNKPKEGWGVLNGIPTEFQGASYVLRYTVNGNRKWETVGGDLAVALAARQRREQIQAAQQSCGEVGPARSPVVQMERRTLDWAITDYQQDALRTKRRRSVLAYKADLEQFAQSCRKKYVDEVQREDVLDFIAYLRKRKSIWKRSYSPRTVFNKTQSIVSFLRKYGRMNLLGKYDWPKYQEKLAEAYTEDEIEALLAHADAEFRLALRFFLATGCREGEVIHACYSDLDFRKKTFRVQDKPQYDWTPKSQESYRSIPVGGKLMEELKARQGTKPGSALLFPATHGGVEGHFLRKIHEVRDKAGLHCAVNLHKLRKTYATKLIQRGESLPTVRARLGHRDLTVILNYVETVRLNSPEARASADAMDAYANVG